MILTKYRIGKYKFKGYWWLQLPDRTVLPYPTWDEAMRSVNLHAATGFVLAPRTKVWS